MKKLIFWALMLFFTNITIGQVTNEGKPKSWKESFIGMKKESLKVIKMPTFDLLKLRMEDAINDKDKSKVYRFGYEFDVDFGFKNAGVWEQLSSGDWIWRIRFKSDGAKTLNFVCNEYKLPEGASLYLYSEDRKDLLGAYTDAFNRTDGMLGTWMVEGDDIILEYYVPESKKGQGEFNISKVVHGYRSVTDFDIKQKALNDSGDCNQDVDCPVGNDFETLKNELKSAVGLMVVGSSGFCTGTLINNTANDSAPYFLTANHCFENTNGTGNTAIWAFRFNWISPNPSCATTTPSTNGTFDQTTSGSTILARNSESDFLLVNIDTSLPESWDLEWAGWDRTGDSPSFVVGIHHPSGDIMKLCRENISPTKVEEVGIGGLVAAVDSWRVADWDLGVTERGSSGSAIFDPTGRIIGQLAGGAAACSGTVDNNAQDFYGRFDVSWDFGTTDATRLSNWLDPGNTGRTTLNSLTQEISLSVEDNIFENQTVIYPIPSNGVFNVSNKTKSQLDYIVFNIIGQKIDQGIINKENETINISSNTSGIYFITLTNTTNSASFTKKIAIW
ncbi:T9SS type A sorting domain-containing protein [Aquimarina sp. MMG016]|uniref:T9SS type A sorting domain-containing protein n=1 Tax=Aquimarina sp. MMG016 TaxID=2822690 RepID=UPI001B39E38C|nr:T9SS type A sorting domain-containing protein [Aquimarina sp. MMG016]MBQ4821576.1 T9SS type A sorting domain-containing protein [Aquimarina sp. MMG016]